MPRVYLPKGTDKDDADKLRELLAERFRRAVYMGFDDEGMHMVVPGGDRELWTSIIRDYFRRP